MAKLNGKNSKNPFYEEQTFVGLTQGFSLTHTQRYTWASVQKPVLLTLQFNLEKRIQLTLIRVVLKLIKYGA
jgi:hypothetical protein